ncbi:hypothetical protein Nmel_014491 [Mimus melanotis]
MKNCTDQEYWDSLVSQCIPCSLTCSQPQTRRCDAVCESMDCNKKPGFYYDELVKSCIKCSLVCGQHPKECALSCELEQRGYRAAVRLFPRGGHSCCQLFPHPKVTLEVSELLHLPPQPRPRGRRPCWSRRDARSRTRGWCCTCCWGSASAASSAPCSWAGLTCAGRERGCPARPALGPATAGRTLPKVKAAPKSPQLTHSLFADRLVEAGSVGDGFTSIRIPEPVETCGFCFPGHGSAVQETKSSPSSSCHPGDRAAPSFSGICSTGSAGAIPSPDDGHFKIICSPSQEKTPMV